MIYGTTGKLSEGMTLQRQLNNRPAWISIAKFLEVDPLVKLGLPGGWVRPEAAPAEGAPLAGKGGSGSASVSSLPVGNHGDNNV